LGTGHCIGMCGPLVLALPGRSGRFLPHLAYHLGRVLTYTAIGALMGGVGAGLMQLGGAEGAQMGRRVLQIQVYLALLTAALLLWFGAQRINLIPEPQWMSTINPERLPGYQRLLRAGMGGSGWGHMLVVGLLMGFLPCGHSYGVFTRALPVGSAAAGALMVLIFGLGTVPGLLLVGLLPAGLVRRYRRPSDIIAGLIMIFMALALLAQYLPQVLG
ncbi:MAG: sulfite exporter TauE/SafE family protein, partial [Desulfobacterales bacterium]